jgi:hypothetical protein
MSDRRNRSDRPIPEYDRRQGEMPPDPGDIADDAERDDAAVPLPHADDIVGGSSPGRE